MIFVDVFQLGDFLKYIATMVVIIGYVIEFGFIWVAYKIYTSELFPTCMRSIALSAFSSTSLVGIALSPQLVYLSKFWNPAPYAGGAIAAALSTICAAAFLPRTQFIALPDTVHQATNRDLLYKETGLPTARRTSTNRKFSTRLSVDANEFEDEVIMLEPREE